MANKHNYQFLHDPLQLIRVLWPHIKLYKQQREIVYSVWHNRETIAVAGNMLGKDFVAALIVLTFFLTRNPCRVVTTSVSNVQLEGVLWGEIRRLIQTSKIPLLAEEGGPLVVNHLHIRKMHTSGPLKGQIDGISYIRGIVADKPESMLGHHANPDVDDGLPHTLFVSDEASGVEDIFVEKAETWAARRLFIGNPYPCTNHFYRAVEEGDVEAKPGEMPAIHSTEGATLDQPGAMITPMLRRVITITADDSPSVRWAKAQIAAGESVTGERLIPGVLSWPDYCERRRMWDPVKQSIQLDAKFWKGGEVLLFPPQWLNESERLLDLLRTAARPVGRAIGCDPGEGAAETAWYVVDEWGILDEVALRTGDVGKGIASTADIGPMTLDLARKWGVPDEMIMFDRGGGGRQIANDLRKRGHAVQTIGFGDAVTPPPRSGQSSVKDKKLAIDDRYTYVSKRAEMYGRFSNLLDPGYGVPVEEFGPGKSRPYYTSYDEQREGVQKVPRFCIPQKYRELRRQLALIPKMLDGEGRMWLPSKDKKKPESKEKTLTEIIGCSPDRADALVVAVYCRDFVQPRHKAGAA